MLLAACAGDETGTGGSGASGGGSTTSAGGAGGEGAGSSCIPGTEICDGKDNDCDEQIDEVAGGCACNDGQSQPCYSGRAGTEGIGECQAGSQTCDNGKWGACDGEVIPEAEACNQLDDDCNGTPDDMGQTSCGVGACAATVDVCSNGRTQVCTPGMPQPEICDGIDNNCNQVTDESDPALGAACDSGLLGVCQAGTNVCTMGALVCVPNQMAGIEACDDLDNDCNDNVPGTGGACNTGQLGVCAAGTVSCLNGSVDCYPDTPASTEICDLLDNDCNGQTDESDPLEGTACDTGLLGVCQPGTVDCNSGSLDCVPNATASSEVCNGIDDNCDGQADEGNPGGGVGCGCGNSGTTACVNGSVVCQGGPTVYFQEDFSDNSAGWTLGPNWQIGSAVGGCAGCVGNPDPALDHTPTADNGIAGVVLGGPAPTASVHGFYWLESPAFNTAVAPGSVYLSFWRFLNSDYLNYMQNAVQVWNGSTWVDLPYGLTGNCCPGVQDSQWTNQPLPAGAPAQATNSAQYPTQFDLTPYKNANMRIRFGYRVGSLGVYTIGSWNLDDVIVSSAICP